MPRRLFWTVIAAAVLQLAAPLPAAPWVAITEIHYHPARDPLLEFVEIVSREPPRVDLSGWRLEGEVSLEFPQGTILRPGEFVVLARDPGALRKRYPEAKTVLGPVSGSLDNKGGPLRLRNAAGATVCEMVYGRGGLWPTTPDGAGHTLSILDPLLDPRAPRNWAPSRFVGGTPGKPNDLKSATRRSGLLINEVSVLAEEPPGGGEKGVALVEIFNPTSREISLRGYSLGDDSIDPQKLSLPEVTLKPHGFLVLGGRDLEGKLVLKGTATSLILFRDGGRAAADLVRLGQSTERYGRFPDGSRDLCALDRSTPGAANVARVTTDIVINEIMYHAITGESADEFVELYNRGDRTIPLRGMRFWEGIRYEFENGTGIRPGEYLVIARDPELIARKYGLDRARVLGPFRGHLANSGEVLTLADGSGCVVDRVEYGDRAPWPHWADGLGNSMELTNPFLDNSLAGAWAASDDRRESTWKSYRYTGTHHSFDGRDGRELQFLLLNEGQCLIDDVHLRSRAGDLVVDGSFDRGGADWRPRGTHRSSGPWVEEGARGEASYRLVAAGRGDPRHNFITLPVPRGVVAGAKYRISFRARWQRGCPQLVSRMSGHSVARVHRLPVPRRPGTPGEKNSTFTDSGVRPVVGTPQQVPVTPSKSAAVTLSVRICALGKLREASIVYRRNGESAWRRAGLLGPGMTVGGQPDGEILRGTIPPLAEGIVEFYIAARDRNGIGTFPAGAPDRTASYAVGLKLQEGLPNYALVVTDREWESLKGHESLVSSRLARGTFVYGDSRIFYDVQFRQRGSPPGRDGRTAFNSWRIIFGAETPYGRRKINVDGQGGDGKRPHEPLNLWMLDELRVPSPRLQHVHFRLLGPRRQEGIYQDVEKIDGEFIARWFDRAQLEEDPEKSRAPTRSGKFRKKKKKTRGSGRGRLHKIDNHYEFFSVDEEDRERRGARFDFTSKDAETYRWNFPLRSNGIDEDFGPLVELIRLMDPDTTADSLFLRRVEALVDVDEWLRVLAARALVGDHDTFGRLRGKNAYLYLPPEDGRWRLLPWDCDFPRSWREPRKALFTRTFPSINRLLEVPQYRRKFFGYLGYLANRKLAASELDAVLDEFAKHSGISTDSFRRFGAGRRSFVLSQIPAGKIQITSTKRMKRTKMPDVLRVKGTAPPLVQRFELDGRPGRCDFRGMKQWTAVFPIGPGGGKSVLRALDFGGQELGSITVTVRARVGAMSLAGKKS